MTINELLNLDKTQASIQKINMFLCSIEKNSYEYVKALAFKALVLDELNKTSEALKLLYEYIPDIKEMTNEAKIALLDGIISITLKNDLYDQTIKYIELKKSFLPLSKGSLYIKDKIELYLKMNDYSQAKIELLSYLQDDISKDEMIYAKIKLSDIYYTLKQYDRFVELIPELKNYYETNLALESLSILTIKDLKISLERMNYNRVINEGNSFIEANDIKMKYIIEISSMIIKAYVEINELKKASILESNYREYLSGEYLLESLDFCYSALELYKRNNSLVSIKEYEAKIIEFEAIKNKEKPKTKKHTKSKEISIPIVEIPQNIIEEISENNDYSYLLRPKKEEILNRTITKEKIKDINVSKTYDLLRDVFDSLNQVDLDMKFREIFRLSAISISKAFDIEEMYILYFNRSYLGLHYKKERVYDKKLDVDNLNHTIAYQTILQNNELFLDEYDRAFSINIVTNEEYPINTYAYSVPISNSLECFGSITYISNKPFIESDGVYESLKLISMMLGSRLLLFMKTNQINLENQKLIFIKDNMSSGLKECVEGYIHLNKQAHNILGGLEDLTLDDYYNHMEISDVTKYKNIIESLYNLDSTKREIEYDYNKDGKIIRVKERFYPLLIEGTIHILSLIDDISKDNNDKNKLLALAYTNPISKLDTEYKLLSDLEVLYSKRQLSLTVLSVHDFKIYEELYGYIFIKQLTFAIGKAIKESISSNFDFRLYHLEGDQFAILMEKINDKRSIDSKLLTIFNRVHDEIFKINTRTSIYFIAGVFRMSKNMNIEKSSLILDYAKEALNNCKNAGLCHNIVHYDGEEARKNFNKKNLVTHISECIDHGSLILNYQQIVNLKNVDVYGYNIKIGIDNLEIEDNLFNSVIKRRDLENQIDKYLILNAFKEEKMLYDKCRGYINIFIEINLDTFDSSFISFINTQLQFFKIDSKFITFIIKNASSLIIQKIRELGFKIASYELLDVFREYTDYYLYDYHLSKSDNINEIYEICNKHKAICILTEINSKEDIEFARKQEYSIVIGKYYKKNLRIKGIIDSIKKE